MFRPKIKLDVIFPARKAIDACREVVGEVARKYLGYNSVQINSLMAILIRAGTKNSALLLFG